MTTLCAYTSHWGLVVQKRNAYKSVVGKPETKDFLGRPGRRKRMGVKYVLNTMGDVSNLFGLSDHILLTRR